MSEPVKADWKMFNKEVLAACVKIEGVARALDLLKKVPETPWNPLQTDLGRAALSCDPEWGVKLVGSGARPMDNLNGARGVYAEDTSLFSMWWNGCERHGSMDEKRVLATVLWLDSLGVGLGTFDGRASGQSLEKARAALAAGGGDKKKARIWSALEWLGLGTSYNNGKSHRPGLKALLGVAKRWGEDSDLSARASPDEIFDAMCGQASSTEKGLLALSEVSKCFGLAVGARRWDMVANGLSALGGGQREIRRASALVKLLSSDVGQEPLGERAATRMVALALREGSAELLATVCSRAPNVDWTLGEAGAEHASECLGTLEAEALGKNVFKGKTVSALHLVCLSIGYMRSYEYRKPSKDIIGAMLAIPAALEAAKANPLPEGFLYFTSSDMLKLAKASKELCEPDAKGRSIAHVWADCAAGPEDVGRVGRLMGTSLAGLVSAPDAKGERPCDKLRKIKGHDMPGILRKLDLDLVKWEKQQLGKEIGREIKAGSAKARRL